jgi:uncharacterized repeat protein (TIGR03806 family)
MSGVLGRHFSRFIILYSTLLAGCGQQVVLHAPEAYPQRLSDWHMVWRNGNAFEINGDAQVYDLNTPLFSDYALKLRTLYLPDGKAAVWNATESFDFPVGTIVTKTFFYQVGVTEDSLTRHTSWDGTAAKVNFDDFRIMETRVLVRQPSGWDALPYIWNGEDAVLSITGKVIPASLDGEDFAYLVPSRNECGSCHITNHTAKQLLPIGLKARHLNRPSPTGNGNQLVALADRGWLSALPEIESVSRSSAMHDPTSNVEDRARAYLDINCGHCHNANGAADTSGLLLDRTATDARQMGRCKPTIAAGHGSGGRTYGIVPGHPDDSILLWRMQTTDPGARMPEIGRSLVHIQGVDLVREWIADQPGTC